VDQQEARGTLLWAADADTSRESIQAAALQFGINAYFCTLAEVQARVRASRCDLVGIELGMEPRAGLATLKEVHERLPRLAIIAAAQDSSMAIIRAALESGASDFLSLPLAPQELQKALIKFTQLNLARTKRAAVGEVITVCAARGGLGATTLSVNLAVRLTALTGAEVGLVDLDLQRGDVAAFLNLTPSQSLAAVSAARGEVDEIFMHGILTRHTSGVFVLPAPQRMEEADLIGHDDVKLALDVLRTQFRYTVVDTPRTITPATLAAIEDADRVLVLSDLSVPGVRAAQRTVDLLKRMNMPLERVGLIITHAVPGPVELKEATRTIGREPMLVIPRDEAASKAMNTGAPLNGGRQTGLALAIAELAGRLGAGGLESKAPRANRFRRIFTKETRA